MDSARRECGARVQNDMALRLRSGRAGVSAKPDESRRNGARLARECILQKLFLAQFAVLIEPLAQ